MTDSDLKRHLETIEKELVSINESFNSLGSAFLRGIVYGAGYILGAAFIIVIIGWLLNIIGVIPELNNEVNDFKNALDKVGGPMK